MSTSTVSITVLKAHLSRFLDRVRSGEEVIVTDRGRPVARLAPLVGDHHQEGRLRKLIREGRIRPPRESGPLDLDSYDLPSDPQGLSLRYLLEERREGR